MAPAATPDVDSSSWAPGSAVGAGLAGRGDEFRRYSYADVFESPRFMLVELSGRLRNIEMR